MVVWERDVLVDMIVDDIKQQNNPQQHSGEDGGYNAVMEEFRKRKEQNVSG